MLGKNSSEILSVLPHFSLFLPPLKLSNESRQILGEELPWAEISTPFAHSSCGLVDRQVRFGGPILLSLVPS